MIMRVHHLHLGILAAAVFLIAPVSARAATLFLAPATSQVSVGRTVDLAVMVNTMGVAMNAAEATLTFDPAALQVQSLTFDGSILDLRPQEPTFSNTSGDIKFSGVVLNPGYTGASGKLVTIHFKTISAGRWRVDFSDGRVLANDGYGTDILTGMFGAVITVGGAFSPEPNVSPSLSGSPQPTEQPGFGLWRPLIFGLPVIGWIIILIVLALLLWWLLHRRRKR